PIFHTLVYAKCNRVGRYDLWDTLREITESIEGLPWMVSGDFNIFLHPDERVGSLLDRSREMWDFAQAVADCELIDAGCKGEPFTWVRDDLKERLDRALVSEAWSKVFAVTAVSHLTQFGSDHSPLLIRCRFSSTPRRSSFRFQNMWVRHHSFHDTVRDSWLQPTGLFGMRNLEAKLGRLRRRLRQWNWNVFGNLHQHLSVAQSAHAKAERAYDLDPTLENRTAMRGCHAEYMLRLLMEENFWKQKAAVRWVAEDEQNTRFFQGFIRQKHAKSHIHSIEADGSPLTQESQIRESATAHFQTLFTSDRGDLDAPIASFFPTIPPSVDLVGLCELPSREE
ncbi:Unknown protein, partial [Striga hermonthica]